MKLLATAATAMFAVLTLGQARERRLQSEQAGLLVGRSVEPQVKVVLHVGAIVQYVIYEF